jgi:murein DD-endopeptidase MepM/ murein hydrolase activator NlpD
MENLQKIVRSKLFWVVLAVIILIVTLRKIGLIRLRFSGKKAYPITKYKGELTPRGIDDQGSGAYNSSRSGGRLHQGYDLRCEPGADVFAPYDSIVARTAKPYQTDDRYSGLLLQAPEGFTIKIMYMQPLPGIVGKSVVAGQLIGVCQNIAKKYGSGMTPHLHIEVEEWGLKQNPEPYIFNQN